MRLRAILLAALVSVVAGHHFRRQPNGGVPRHAELKLLTSKPGHLFSTEEHVKLEVSGVNENDEIQVNRSDPAGQPLEPVKAVVSSGTADFGGFPAGWYHMSPTGGSADSAVDIAVTPPSPLRPARDDSPFGLVAPPHEAKEWKMLADMGCAWLQWSMVWSLTEPQPGQYWFMPNTPKLYGDPESYVRDANKNNIRTVIQIRTTPKWANQGKIGSYKDPGDSRSTSYPPDDQHWDDYAKYVEQVVSRYKPLGVNHYEIWSEANEQLFKGWATPQFPRVEAYQKMLQTARRAIKQKDPDALVLGNGDIPVELLRFAEKGYTAPAKEPEYAGMTLPGIGKAVDIVTGHFYWTDYKSRPRTHYGPEATNPGRAPHTLKEMIADAQELAGSRPVWITEVGYASGTTKETPDNIAASSEDEQANLLVRYYLLARCWGAKKIFWYTWKDYESGGTLQNAYGLLRKDGTVKPAYLAYKTLAERMEGLDWELRESGPNRYIVHGKGPHLVAVVWKLDAGNKPDSFSMPFKKVRVTRRDGETEVMTPVNGKVQVQLKSGEPVYLDEAP